MLQLNLNKKYPIEKLIIVFYEDKTVIELKEVRDRSIIKFSLRKNLFGKCKFFDRYDQEIKECNLSKFGKNSMFFETSILASYFMTEIVKIEFECDEIFVCSRTPFIKEGKDNGGTKEIGSYESNVLEVKVA